MSAGLRRFLGTGAGRQLLVPGVRAPLAAAKPAQLLPPLQPLLAARCCGTSVARHACWWSVQRQLGALTARPLSSNAVLPQVQEPVRPDRVLPPTASQLQVEDLPPAATAAAPNGIAALTGTQEEAAATILKTASTNAMVFEIGLTFTFMHYQSIFIFFARGLFQAFRPLLILFVFGQILKAVFFVAGAPIWCSFYSIWMFEVIYGLAQCAISFIFICSFYNNLSFARLRPALRQVLRQERDRLQRATRCLGLC